MKKLRISEWVYCYDGWLPIVQSGGLLIGVESRFRPLRKGPPSAAEK